MPKQKVKQPPGMKVRMENYSDEVLTCAQTGVILPNHGMVVEYDNKLFCNRAAVRTYIKGQQ